MCGQRPQQWAQWQVKIPGWHELRTGQATWDEIITPTSLTGISFVGCGEWAPEGSGPEFDQQLFEPLRSAFSFVLIDGDLAEEIGGDWPRFVA